MTNLRCEAILFDLDGVLVDSRETVERIWQRWASERGLDPAPFIRVAHGRRISETLRMVAPDLDIRKEVAALDAMEEVVTEGTRAAPGAGELIAEVPPGRWGIVTSGSNVVARLRLSIAGLPAPGVFITAEQVRHGKPDPEGYLAGARALGRSAGQCLVFEDAPPGVLAGVAAGMRVMALLTTHDRAALPGALEWIASLSSVTVADEQGGLLVEWS